MTTAIDHIAIVANDIDAARDFLVQNFGFTARPLQMLSGGWVDVLNGMENVVTPRMRCSNSISGSGRWHGCGHRRTSPNAK